MAKSNTRRVTIYINGKEGEASYKQSRSVMNEKKQAVLRKFVFLHP